MTATVQPSFSSSLSLRKSQRAPFPPLPLCGQRAWGRVWLEEHWLFYHSLHLSSCLLKWQVFHITKAPVTAKFILQWEPIWVRRQKEGRFWQKEQVKERLQLAIYKCWVRELENRVRTEERRGNISRLPKAAPCTAQVQRSLFILELGGEARRDIATSLLGAAIGTPPSFYFSLLVNPLQPPES